MRRAILALAALSTALAAQAQPLPVEVASRTSTDRLAPSSPWNLDFGENKCRLQRVFEHEGRRHAVIIEQSAPDSSFSLVLAGPALTRLKGIDELALGLNSDIPLVVNRRILPGTLPDYGSAFVLSSVSLTRFKPGPSGAGPQPHSAEIDVSAAAMVNRIVLANAKGKQAVSYETGNMRDVFAALNVCTSDFLVQWGLDPEQHRAYRRPHLANGLELTRYLQRTYPDRALEKGEGGVFGFRLIVEADGSISSCHVEANSAVTELDPRCADIVKIAQMEPALDAEGKPMRSFYVTKLTFLTS